MSAFKFIEPKNIKEKETNVRSCNKEMIAKM